MHQCVAIFPVILHGSGRPLDDGIRVAGMMEITSGYSSPFGRDLRISVSCRVRLAGAVEPGAGLSAGAGRASNRMDHGVSPRPLHGPDRMHNSRWVQLRDQRRLAMERGCRPDMVCDVLASGHHLPCARRPEPRRLQPLPRRSSKLRSAEPGGVHGAASPGFDARNPGDHDAGADRPGRLHGRLLGGARARAGFDAGSAGHVSSGRLRSAGLPPAAGLARAVRFGPARVAFRLPRSAPRRKHLARQGCRVLSTRRSHGRGYRRPMLTTPSRPYSLGAEPFAYRTATSGLSHHYRRRRRIGRGPLPSR